MLPFLGREDIILIQISFDGNNSDCPPDLMEGYSFQRLKNEVNLNFVSCINIIYTGNYDFKDCDINNKAKRKLLEKK